MSRMLRVGGMVPLTTIDYPGQLACVLFCQGCAWRCRYCHNPQLIPPRGTEEMDWRRVLAFLQRRQDLLDAVVFSGGEPTLQDALPNAMDEVRTLGFRIGLHSAGIKPAAFSRALAGADWVGFDVKALPEDCQAITRVEGSGTANWRSLEHLLASGVAYECRTTVHWHLFEPARLLILAQRLSQLGVKRFAVQLVRTERMFDPLLSSVSAQALLPELWAEMRELFPAFVLRG
ncbi:anaerobic ribonucleoside-triphosphate reductase activating protein [Pseudomonas fluorescens]|uniref:7-carboxy-7-deazaguanine synthase n=1 Tax=Pseudomonas fluorescens TaxID=294 RepID=A0A5E7S0D1_PSEFL|nr:anaerobic ribonucleoside-triphosphate reductase activating protein [Pseudomonas fluorescens]VVP79107.1 7-carboxy-7-deazaguanine synthase [Pseudomonas fluorescens]